MSSKKKINSKLEKDKESSVEVQKLTAVGPIKIRTDKPDFVQFSLHVKPGAKMSRIAEITENFIGVQISAPPRDGEANEEVIKYFSHILNVKERQVTLISGSKSRDKQILVENVKKLSIDDFRNILIKNQED